MINKINFISGETYTLAEMFSGVRKIIIPDLQRDYCWGDSVHTDNKIELVSGFVGNLIDIFNNFKESNLTADLNLGLIYGYEIPENHIQLCDGQQRITTLFLLVGMLNRKTGEKNSFRRQLMSDFEYKVDDKEPYLQYSIRETSLYFISDLVCHFFVSEKDDKYSPANAKDIVRSSWFFNEYLYDPSIQSMLRAIGIIENILDGKSKAWCEEFGDFIINKLTFLYYDLENRENGEETFVVINTTGEPLSATQNLKPLVCNAEVNKDVRSIATFWEEIETWFWRKRQGDNDTADAGFNEFLRWFSILQLYSSDIETAKKILSSGKYSFDYNVVKFKDIFSYWKSVKFLFDEWEYHTLLDASYLSPAANNELDDIKGISQIGCFVLLPLIEYCKTYDITDSSDRNLYRLYMFLLNLSRISNVTKAVNDLVTDAIKIGRNCRDIIEILNKPQLNISKVILSEEEITKLEILRDADNREEIEEAFWNTQSTSSIPCHYIWQGQIFPLIKWSQVNGFFDIEKFKVYSNTFDNVFKDDGDSCIDNVRRALLTRNLNLYPRIFSGYTIYSFGWEWIEWKILINDNLKKFQEFLDDLIQGKTYEDMISQYPIAAEWSDFVKDENLLGYCNSKKLQWHNGAWYLMKKERWSSAHANVNAYKFYLYLKKRNLPVGWNLNFYSDDDSCVYYDYSIGEGDKMVAIDIIWNPSGNVDNIEIDLFMRDTDEDEAKMCLQQIADNKYHWIENRYRCFLPLNTNYSEIERECLRIFAIIDDPQRSLF